MAHQAIRSVLTVSTNTCVVGVLFVVSFKVCSRRYSKAQSGKAVWDGTEVQPGLHPYEETAGITGPPQHANEHAACHFGKARKSNSEEE